MTTTYTFDQLKEDVKKEAEALRLYATKGERDNLNIEYLLPTNMDKCIYGQMTGHCFSQRAAFLIDKCCVRYFKHNIMPDFFTRYTSMSDLQRSVNGANVTEFIKERTCSISECHFSAIEAYILLPEAKNANLIAFLRGETETLEL